MAAARTAAEVMTSFLLSAAVAASVSEEILRPSARLKAAIQSLTSMEATSATTVATPNSVASGLAIFATDSMTRFTPMAVTRMATTRPARYSKRPWP